MSVVIRCAVCTALAFALAVVAAGTAVAGPEQRVVLADPDPELVRAVRSALGPWRLRVIVEARAPADDAEAEAQARRHGAQFIVWRDSGELFVLDRARHRVERRVCASGPLTPARAAAAALTVKTLMRLPPPAPLSLPRPPVEPEPLAPLARAPVPPAPAALDPPAEHRPNGPELRAQVALMTRLAISSLRHDLGVRCLPALLVRPSSASRWRLGATADLGTPSSVQAKRHTLSWTDWSVGGIASWTVERERWEIEVQASGGVVRSVVDGYSGNGNSKHQQPYRREATLGALSGGLQVRLRRGWWTIGAAVSAGRIFRAPAHTPDDNPDGAIVFQVPDRAFSLGVVSALDFGRDAPRR